MKNDPKSKVQITKIPDQLFYGCFIRTLALSEEITTIGIASFSNFRIKEIQFHPKSKLTEIGDNAFYRTEIIQNLLYL